MAVRAVCPFPFACVLKAVRRLRQRREVAGSDTRLQITLVVQVLWQFASEQYPDESMCLPMMLASRGASAVLPIALLGERTDP